MAFYEAYISTYDDGSRGRFFSEYKNALEHIINEGKKLRLSKSQWLHHYSLIIAQYYIDSDKEHEYIFVLKMTQFDDYMKEREGK